MTKETALELLEKAKGLVAHLKKIEGGKWLNNRSGEELEVAIRKAEDDWIFDEE